jgi:hypothetical protein
MVYSIETIKNEMRVHLRLKCAQFQVNQCLLSVDFFCQGLFYTPFTYKEKAANQAQAQQKKHPVQPIGCITDINAKRQILQWFMKGYK